MRHGRRSARRLSDGAPWERIGDAASFDSDSAERLADVTVLRRHRWLQGTLLLAPAVTWIAIFVVVPAAITVITSFWSIVNYRVAHVWTLHNYGQIFHNSLYYDTLLHTVEKAAITGVVAATLSLPLAWTIVFHIRRRRLFALGLVVIAMWMGYLLRAYGWRLVFGDQGVINVTLEKVGLTDHPLSFLLFNDFAVIVVLVHLSLPFAFIPIYLALERLPPDLLDAASDLGANRRRSLLYVVRPIVGNSVWAGATFAFIVSFGDLFRSTACRWTEFHNDWEHRGQSIWSCRQLAVRRCARRRDGAHCVPCPCAACPSVASTKGSEPGTRDSTKGYGESDCCGRGEC